MPLYNCATSQFTHLNLKLSQNFTLYYQCALCVCYSGAVLICGYAVNIQTWWEFVILIFMVEWLPPLLCIQEVPGSNLSLESDS